MHVDRFSSLYGSNSPYMEELYTKFQANPESVDQEWRTFFESVNTGYNMVAQKSGAGSTVAPVNAEAMDKQSKVQHMVDAFRARGHKYAQINPLRLVPGSQELTLERFGLSQADLQSEFATDGVLTAPKAKLSEIIAALEATYTSSIGVQYMEISNFEERKWLRAKMEGIHNKPSYSADEKKRILEGLMSAEKFENFLHTKYVGKKRFSGEGAESLIPMLDTMTALSGTMGVKDIVVGMAHRARLNVLVNIFEKPFEEIFAGFDESLMFADEESSSDVKYHMGRSCDVTTRDGNSVHISLLNNPSHLEAVNPMVEGSARAKQRRRGENGAAEVVPVLIHGDAAVAGQGVVAETLNMANLKGYTTGGTIHVVINNQIGFTAEPEETFSGEYCTDVARMLQVPIFHVNGDDAEACNLVMQLAVEYRQTFKKDVFIDLVCYRKYGHNEGDDPTFTSPEMYKIIKKHNSPYITYKNKLLSEGAVTEADVKKIEDNYIALMQGAYERTRGTETKVDPDMFRGEWAGFEKSSAKEAKTAISKKLLGEIANSFTDLPFDFKPHPKIAKGMQKRTAMLKGDEPMDWGAAEVAAYAALLNEGFDVRLSGQDVNRGTFSHRHAALWDNENGNRYYPIEQFKQGGAQLDVHSSCLSELAVLGFEYGYSLAAPKTLTIWEAQFGDFANGAQITYDQFISCAEHKWHRMSGLTCLLPHGYEGQGPEHSSARPERFLQLCAQDNMIVANVTTPAQIFHLLRRQMHQSVRKPLVVMSPKSLLRHPKATSTPDDLTSGAFQKVLPETQLADAKVKKVVLCTGKVYYDLLAHREKEGIEDTALVRVEQLYPVAETELKNLQKQYKNAKTWVWAQEEPKNMGAWSFVRDHLVDELGLPLVYSGRPAAAAPAVGHTKRHLKEQDKLIKETFAK